MGGRWSGESEDGGRRGGRGEDGGRWGGRGEDGGQVEWGERGWGQAGR